MNIFKGNRVKNFTIIILAVMCTMLITMGFLFYRKEIQNQKEYFSDIGFYYTDLIKRTLNQQVMLEIDKIQVILKDDSIEQYCKNNDIEVVGKLPYDNIVTEAMIREKNVIEFSDGDLSDRIIDMWNGIRGMLLV